ncbi:MAG TPA: iron-containing redox enzyme family protein [Candidatus Acidoferrales bacterium]|nr:iron-containing redox enzyme family protein [Candidatus Acidoferrales bacterium]
MDKATFHTEIDRIVAEHRLDQHPYVKLVREGRATRAQLKGYPIQHYEMTVRDSAPISAVSYLKMYDIDKKVARGSAKGFAEEALGLYSHSAGHTELLFELWEGGLGLPREQLINSIGSEEARVFNACMHRIVHLKPHFVGAIGLCEEIEVPAYLMIQQGLEQHYGVSPVHTRFLAVHYEADKQHGEGGHRMIDRFVTGSGREEEFLAEARTLTRFFWKGFDAMLAG